MKLLDLFDICEDLEDTNGLESLFFIIKDICNPPFFTFHLLHSNVPSHPFLLLLLLLFLVLSWVSAAK